MTAELRHSATLVASVVLWSPALGRLLVGELELGAAGVRYAASLAGSWLAVAGLDAFVRGYGTDPSGAVDTEASEPRRRRSDDLTPAGDGGDLDQPTPST